MEQLVWAIIIFVFIIFTALKNRARSNAGNRPDTNTDRTTDTEQITRDEADKLGRYMEELLGIERPVSKPQVRIKKKPLKPVKEKVTPREKPVIKKKVGQFDSPLAKKYEKKQESPLHAKKKIYHAKFPWSSLSKKDLPNAIILSEIIGPPISKRKSHRLF